MSAPNTKAISAASRDKFLAVWPGLRDELLGYLDNENMPKDAHDWFKRVSHRTPRAQFGWHFQDQQGTPQLTSPRF